MRRSVQPALVALWIVLLAGGGPATLEPLAAMAAPDAILVDQTSSASGNAPSQNFEAVYDSNDNQAADDFVVLASGGWLVKTVFAPGVYSPTHGSPQSIHVTFFQDAGGVPGAPVCDYPQLSYVEAPVGSFTVTLPGAGCLLGSGVNWVSVQANLSLISGGEWFWRTRTVLSHNLSAWQNPGGGYGFGCTTWGTRTSCLNQTDPDMAFSLQGSVASCSTDPECSDGNPCNGTETCVAASCASGTPVNCDDGDVCTIDSCTPDTGACAHAQNFCDDGDSCTVDRCTPGVGCSHPAPAPSQSCSSGTITIPSSGAASPYPSPIAVAGLGTIASLCSVELRGFSHSLPDDVDVLVSGPGAGSPNALVMSDVGGTNAVSGVNLILKDAAAGALPDFSTLVSGTFKPTNVGTGDAFPAPAPVPSGNSALSAFNGRNPNGTWSLYVVDDSAGSSGSLQSWCVNVVVKTCTVNADCGDGNLCNGIEVCSGGICQNGSPVNCDDAQPCTVDTCVPASGACQHAPNSCDDGDGCTADTCVAGAGCAHTNLCVKRCNNSGIDILDELAPTAASPYPSTIAVTGLDPYSALVSVELHGLTHAFPDDVDMLLVGPLGLSQNARILSDVGGETTATGIELVLSDSAANFLPDEGPLLTGTFKPTNFEVADTFVAPAPAPAVGSSLSVFTGNPNGTWSLYVVDDEDGDAGSLAGWCLNLRPACAETPALVAGVRFQSNHQTLSWDAAAGATTYDAVRGSLAGLPVGPGGGDETCFGDISGLSLVDAATPASPGGFWYLVRGENACAKGGYGSASSGAPRTTTTCP